MGGLTRRLADDRESIRRLRDRKGHTEVKNQQVGGPIEVGMAIPVFFIGIDCDDETPEWKLLIGFRGAMLAGSVTINWFLNGTLVKSGHSFDTTLPAPADQLSVALDLSDGDAFQVQVTSASDDASGMTAAVLMATAAR